MARFVEQLAMGNIGGSTRKAYLSQFQVFARSRAEQGTGPSLWEGKGEEASVKVMTDFMTYRCFVRKNQSQIVRDYLVAIQYVHMMYAGWELHMAHCLLWVVGREIDRAHAMSDLNPMVRKPLTWEMLGEGQSAVVGAREMARVVWTGPSLICFLRCRVRVVRVPNRRVHQASGVRLTRRDLIIFVRPN